MGSINDNPAHCFQSLFKYLFDCHHNKSLACQISQTGYVSITPIIDNREKNAYFCRKRTFQHQTLFTSIIELSTGFKQGDNHESKGA